MRKLVGLDIETFDPLLKTKGKRAASGWSWKYDEGYIICISCYYPDSDKTEIYEGIYRNEGTSSIETRKNSFQKIIDLFKNPDVSIVGANLQYDIGWILHEAGMETFDVKCRFIDVLQAEHLLDEFNHTISLDTLAKKYLNKGKVKERIEDWIFSNVPEAKGDFRGYLDKAPWDLLCEYVEGDAKLPCLIWKKQLEELKKQDLCKRCKLEFDCILPTLQLTRNGFPIDKDKKDKICSQFKEFVKRYGVIFNEKFGNLFPEGFFGKNGIDGFKPTSSKQIAKICDHLGIAYTNKITIKGKDGVVYETYRELKDIFHQAKKIVNSFMFLKNKITAYVPASLSDRTCAILEEEGFIITCNPNCDKKFFAENRNRYEIISVIADWKTALGILSKILDTEYDRFICNDNRVRGQFNITNTVSFRYSSTMPNMQQIPSKGSIGITREDAEFLEKHSPELYSAVLMNDKTGNYEISFPAITRSLFTAGKGKVYIKIDYSQIEYRLICNIAVGEGSEEVRAEFRKNPYLDFHDYTVKLTELSRKYAKNMSFGISFGMSLPSMAKNFGWTMEKAQEIWDKYHEHIPFVAPTLALVGDVAKKRGYIRTVLGSRARLPDQDKSYTMLNRYTQGSGAEILKSSIIRSYNEGLWKDLEFHVTVHDELGFSIEPTREQVILAYRMSDIMENTVKLNVPLIADIELGDNWNDVHSVDEWLEFREKGSIEWETCSAETKKCVMLCDEIRKEIKEGKIEFQKNKAD